MERTFITAIYNQEYKTTELFVRETEDYIEELGYEILYPLTQIYDNKRELEAQGYLKSITAYLAGDESIYLDYEFFIRVFEFCGLTLSDNFYMHY